MENYRIGLPRALLYYRYGSLWKSLLSGLGFEVITSPETTAGIMKDGTLRSIGDLCLPMKIYLGHVESLREGVDLLFIPRYVSDEPDSFLCPKIIGLPDVVRACFTNLPGIAAPLLHVKRDGDAAYVRFAEELATALGMKKARVAEETARRLGAAAGSLPVEDMPHPRGKKIVIGVIGRDYLVFDRQVGGKIMAAVRNAGAVPIFRVPAAGIVKEAMTIIPKSVYWSMGKEVVASAHDCFKDDEVDGVINLCSAACGPDSFTGDLIRRRLNPSHKPYMSLSVDEHTSDVGLQTRIEAFVDMLLRVTA